jgi:uncharacterized protein (DUF2384 family)
MTHLGYAFQVKTLTSKPSLSESALDATTLERISHVLGIYKALHVLFIDEKQADSWIDRPSVAFGDRPARERLTSGLLSDLIFIRHHLDVARGW